MNIKEPLLRFKKNKVHVPDKVEMNDGPSQCKIKALIKYKDD